MLQVRGLEVAPRIVFVSSCVSASTRTQVEPLLFEKLGALSLSLSSLASKGEFCSAAVRNFGNFKCVEQSRIKECLCFGE